MTAEEIKANVPIREVLARYGLEPNRQGFLCCPFHNEKTPSMKIFDNTNTFHCFGCGAGSNVIDFVMQMESCSFKQAFETLGGTQPTSLRQLRAIANHKHDREQAEKEHQAREDRYFKTLAEWQRLSDNRMKYAPKSADEELHPLFVESLQKLDYTSYLLDLAELEVINCKQTH